MRVEVFLGILIGAITFTGSIVAYGKLAGKVQSKALTLPGRHMLNIGAGVFCLFLGILYFNGAGIWTMVLVAIVAGAIGWHLIMAIGGADMPVVISMLNSYSGWAAAAIGFTLSNNLLIVTGALVGSSGAILSYIMCRAMNRNFVSVILGGFGGTDRPGAWRSRASRWRSTPTASRRRSTTPRASSSSPATAWRWRRRSSRSPSWSSGCGPRARRSASRSIRSRAGCPGT